VGAAQMAVYWFIPPLQNPKKYTYKNLFHRFRIHKNIHIKKFNVKKKGEVFRNKWWQLFPEFVWFSFNHALYVDYYSTFSAQTP
jgi:hypothetical protein